MSENEEEENVKYQLRDEINLEAEVASLRNELGLEHERTITKIFDLFNIWIQLYRLQKIDGLLAEIASVCEKLGGQWKIKYIQMLGFCRWKQYRYQEALTCFHQMESMVGPSAFLCENIGHTYSSIGNLAKAEEYFLKSLELSDEIVKHDHSDETEFDKTNRGGVLLGLGLIKDRTGKIEESLPILEQALKWYQDKVKGTDASLVAKAHMSVGKAHEKLGDPGLAEKHYREALRIFIITCGYENPLSAGAMGSLALVLIRQRNMEEGQKWLKEALTLEACKDSVHLHSVYELMAQINVVHMGPGELDRDAYKQYVPIVLDAEKHMVLQKVPQDGNFAAFAKSAGEICVIAEDYEQGERFLNRAVELLKEVTEVECRPDACKRLIAECNSLLQYIVMQQVKQLTAAEKTG